MAEELPFDREVFLGFLEESQESLQKACTEMASWQGSNDLRSSLNTVFRAFHSIKGNAPFFGLFHLKRLAHSLEGLLDALRSQKIALTPNVLDLLLLGADRLGAMLDRLHSNGPELLDNEPLNEFYSSVEQALQSSMAEVQVRSFETNLPDAPLRTDPKDPKERTLRVKEQAIDAFLGSVSELVVVEEMYENLHSRLYSMEGAGELVREMRRINDGLRELSTKLQKEILEIRRIPVGNLLQRMPRLVRDIANQTHKRIQCSLDNADLPVDKSLLEVLEAPLVHMVRNAADHGIETPAIRQAHGKSPEGSILLRAYEDTQFVTIEIQDDGKGIDHNALLRKAREKGLIGSQESLNQGQIEELLFLPGLSTAEKVSDISGRGVGMDVVKTMVLQAGGRIEVFSELNQGARFRIQLPRSVITQIIQGFVVLSNGQRYVVPIAAVERVLQVSDVQIHTIQESQQLCVIDGQTIALYSLTQLLDGHNPSHNHSIILLLRHADRRMGALIDGTDGIRQVVLKSLQGVASDHPMVMGGAIMGDGTVAMVLDPQKLMP